MTKKLWGGIEMDQEIAKKLGDRLEQFYKDLYEQVNENSNPLASVCLAQYQMLLDDVRILTGQVPPIAVPPTVVSLCQNSQMLQTLMILSGELFSWFSNAANLARPANPFDKSLTG